MSFPHTPAASCRGSGLRSTGASRTTRRLSPHPESARRVAPASRRCSVAPRGRRKRSDPRLRRGYTTSANIARKQFGHEQGRSGITHPSRPTHGGGCRSASTLGRGESIMKCKSVSHPSTVPIGAVAAPRRTSPARTRRRAEPARAMKALFLAVALGASAFIGSVAFAADPLSEPLTNVTVESATAPQFVRILRAEHHIALNFIEAPSDRRITIHLRNAHVKDVMDEVVR